MEPMPPIPADDSETPIPQLSTILSLATPGTNQVIHLLATLPEISLLEEIYIIGHDLLKEYFGLGSLIAILPIPDQKKQMHAISDGLMKRT